MKKEIIDYINLWIESFKRGRQFITHDIHRIGRPGEVVPNGLIIKQIRATILLARGLIEETILLRASALTFATLLFIVPFLAMMFFLIQTFNLGDQVYERMDEQLSKAVTALSHLDEGEGAPMAEGAEEATTPVLGASPEQPGSSDELLKRQMIGWVFPIFDEGHSITEDALYTNPVKIFVALAEEGGKSPHTVGLSGLLFILTTVFGFMRNVEYTLNRIWGVSRQRNLFLMISHYMMITLLLPFVAACIMGISAALESPYIAEMLGSYSIAVRAVQFVVLCLSFTLVYQIVPNTKVYFRYALLGGIVGSTLFMVNSWAYVKFQIGLANYTSFFSTFALFPLLLMYIYISWLILLFGSLVSFAYQNEKTFAMERLAEDAPHAYREALAVRLMLEIARRYSNGLPAVHTKEIAEKWNVPTRLLSETLDALMNAELVAACATTPVSYVPKRSTRTIKVLDVINAVRENGQDPSLLREDRAFLRLYKGLDSANPETMQADVYTMSRQDHAES